MLVEIIDREIRIYLSAFDIDSKTVYGKVSAGSKLYDKSIHDVKLVLNYFKKGIHKIHGENSEIGRAHV